MPFFVSIILPSRFRCNILFANVAVFPPIESSHALDHLEPSFQTGSHFRHSMPPPV